MSEIVIQIHDDISFNNVINILAPYIAKAEIKRTNGKIWNGKAEWLDSPIKMESFTPLSREETHAR
jgi:hypothetical protein